MQASSSSTSPDTKQRAVRNWLDNIPPTFPKATTSHIPISSVINESTPTELCTMTRSSAQSLSALTSSSTIVLFTPVIAAKASPSKTSSGNNTDPFETLGRALSRHHKRIRHVPYHPKIGFTDTHDAFLSQADAVVVVIAEPASNKTESLGDQIEFAENANAALKESLGGRPLKHPVTLIQCGNSEGNWWPDSSAFETVMKCRSYDVDTAQQVARKLFEGRK